MRREFIRFLAGGGFNTLATYLLFLALATWINTTAAYSIAYVAGIVLSYFINAMFVFSRRTSLQTASLYPFVYLAQYLLGLGVLFIATSYFSIAKEMAMLIVIAVNTPITFVISKKVLGISKRSKV